MSSPMFSVSITPEEIVSTLEGWTDQIIKVGSVEDMRRVKQASRNLTSLSKLMNLKASCHLAELSQEKKAQFVNKRNCHCKLCTVKIKQGDVEICLDFQEVLCNKCVKEFFVYENVTKCRDCLMVDINEFKEEGFEWKCDECAYYAAHHYKACEEHGEY
eukprot:14288219-Ditylum_brightwellii.AAC.1